MGFYRNCVPELNINFPTVFPCLIICRDFIVMVKNILHNEWYEGDDDVLPLILSW